MVYFNEKNKTKNILYKNNSYPRISLTLKIYA